MLLWFLLATGCTVLLSTQRSDAPCGSFLPSGDRETPEAVGTHGGPRMWLMSFREISHKDIEKERRDISAAWPSAATWHGKGTDSRDGESEFMALLPKRALHHCRDLEIKCHKNFVHVAVL